MMRTGSRTTNVIESTLPSWLSIFAFVLSINRNLAMGQKPVTASRSSRDFTEMIPSIAGWVLITLLCILRTKLLVG